MSVKLRTLTGDFKAAIENAEVQARRAYGDAICHESPDYDVIAERAHDCYTDMCEQVEVCCKYACFARTDREQYCAEHKEHEAVGL
jgi:hypothetical protein